MAEQRNVPPPSNQNRPAQPDLVGNFTTDEVVKLNAIRDRDVALPGGMENGLDLFHLRWGRYMVEHAIVSEQIGDAGIVATDQFPSVGGQGRRGQLE